MFPLIRQRDPGAELGVLRIRFQCQRVVGPPCHTQNEVGQRDIPLSRLRVVQRGREHRSRSQTCGNAFEGQSLGQTGTTQRFAVIGKVQHDAIACGRDNGTLRADWYTARWTMGHHHGLANGTPQQAARIEPVVAEVALDGVVQTINDHRRRQHAIHHTIEQHAYRA